MTKLWCLITRIIRSEYLNDIGPVLLRIMASITRGLILIFKCSRIRSFRTLFLTFLDSNVSFGLGQCMNCFLVIMVFSHSSIYCSSRRIAMCLLVFRRPTLCAWYLGKGAGVLSPIIHTSRFASLPWRFALQNPTSTQGNLLGWLGLLNI